MTGEMYKPEFAELKREHWEDITTAMGYRTIGDDSVCIQPNYPAHFALAEFLTDNGIDADVRPFDVYQGPYIYVSIKNHGYMIWSVEPGELEDNIWIIENSGEFSDSMLCDDILDYLNNLKN